MDEALGMMDEGYFVSRSEILSWLNTLLQVISIFFFRKPSTYKKIY